MKRFSSLITVCSIAFFLAGCGSVRQVSFVRVLPVPPPVEPAYAATENIYILLDGPSFSLAEGSSQGWTEDFHGALESLELGRALSREIGRRRGRVAAFRVQDNSKFDDRFTRDLHPSAVLLIRGRDIRKKSDRTGVREVEEVRDGKKEKRTIETWTFTKTMGCEVRLLGYPDQKLLFDRSLDQNVQTTCENCGGVISAENEATLDKSLMASLAASVAAAVRPVNIVTLARPVPFQKEAPLSKEAADAAAKGNWDIAQTQWNARLKEDPADWKAAFGLGLVAERRGDYPEAGHWYTRAQELSVESDEAKKIDFPALLASLNTGEDWPARAPTPGGWFDKRVAVLLFSDEVVSLDGPDFVRKTFYDEMKASGYNVIKLEDVDNILSEHGFSDGGQLSTARPAKIAGWLKADRLIFGHVDVFDDQNVGVYRKRAVRAELKMWDAAANDFIWTSDRLSSTKIVTDNIAAGFFGGLLDSWAERSGGKPLAPEVARFTVLNLETLPLRVPE